MTLFSGGCLSGSYTEAYRARVQEYRQEAEFQRLHREPQELNGGRLVLRVPKLFQSQDDKAEKERSKPPFLRDFPAYAVAFETLIPGGAPESKTEFPAVLTIGVPTDKDSVLDDLKKKILAQVQAEREFAKAAWTQVEGQTRTPGVQAWSVLKLTGPQPFERIVEGNPKTETSGGETQIWVASHPESKVSAVLAWRVPEELAAAVPLEELTALVVRTVEFKPPPPAAADPAVAQQPGQEPGQ